MSDTFELTEKLISLDDFPLKNSNHFHIFKIHYSSQRVIKKTEKTKTYLGVNLDTFLMDQEFFSDNFLHKSLLSNFSKKYIFLYITLLDWGAD